MAPILAGDQLNEPIGIGHKGEITSLSHTHLQPDIGHQISVMMLRFEQLLGITAECKCCSRKYKEKIASSRVNEPIAESTEFIHNVFKEGNT